MRICIYNSARFNNDVCRYLVMLEGKHQTYTGSICNPYIQLPAAHGGLQEMAGPTEDRWSKWRFLSALQHVSVSACQQQCFSLRVADECHRKCFLCTPYQQIATLKRVVFALLHTETLLNGNKTHFDDSCVLFWPREVQAGLRKTFLRSFRTAELKL